MFKNYKFIFFLCLFFVFSPSSLASANVVINEIAWMGVIDNWRYEWIELHNGTGQNISLDGWKIELYRDDLDFTIELSGTIENYFLIVSSDVIFDNYDFNYSNLGGKFNNNGQRIVLKNDQEIIVDEIDCFSLEEGWLAGDNNTKQTMERMLGNWQTSLNPGGTPKLANSTGAEVIIEETSEEESADEEEQTDEISITSQSVANNPPIADAGTDITALIGQEISFDGSLSHDPDNNVLTYFWNFGDGATDTEQSPKHTYLYPGQYMASLLIDDGEFSDLDIITVNIYNQSVIISEFMPDPEGTDTENEWIELFNQSDQIANLTNWRLDDQEDGSSPFTFPANSLIAPNQFLVLIRPITKISLNNDNDQVRLFYPDGSLSAEISYLAEKKQGFSIAFNGSDYFWTKTPTPGSVNIISSSNLDAKEKNLSANNPEPVIKQSQDIPENTISINLNQSQQFSALNAPIENIRGVENNKTVFSDEKDQERNNFQPNQTASFAQSAQPNQKSKLILYLSIIISASLFASWGLIMLSKRKRV